MEYNTDCSKTEGTFQFIPELFTGIDYSLAVYQILPKQSPLLIKKEYRLLKNVTRAREWLQLQGRSPLYSFHPYRLEHPPEKFYSPEQWDQGLIIDDDGWSILTLDDLPPNKTSAYLSYYSYRQSCRLEHRAAEENYTKFNQTRIDEVYQRIDYILGLLRETGDGTRLDEDLITEIDELNAEADNLVNYPPENIPSCQKIMEIETEDFFESHWIEIASADMENYTGYKYFGYFAEVFRPEIQSFSSTAGDDFRLWKKSTNKVLIDLHYAHYPEMGYLILSPHRYDVNDTEEFSLTTSFSHAFLDSDDLSQMTPWEEQFIHSPHYSLFHCCRNVNQKYRFDDFETIPINSRSTIVSFPPQRPFPLYMELKRIRGMRFFFIDSLETKTKVKELTIGDTCSFLSRHFLIEIEEPFFDEQFYPPNFAVKSYPFQRLMMRLDEEGNAEYKLSGRYPSNFPCLEIAYHHEFLGIHNWTSDQFTAEYPLEQGNIDGPLSQKALMSESRVYDSYKTLIEEEMGGYIE